MLKVFVKQSLTLKPEMSVFWGDLNSRSQPPSGARKRRIARSQIQARPRAAGRSFSSRMARNANRGTQAGLRRCRAMGQSHNIVSPLALQAIEQCRREIAAGWEQIEGGRRILARSGWLLQRWAEQARACGAAALPPTGTRHPMGGTFEPVDSETPRERLRPSVSARLRPGRIGAVAKRSLHQPHRPADAP